MPAQPHLVLDVGQALGLAWHLPRRADELRLAPVHGAVERHDDDRAPEQTIWSPSYKLYWIKFIEVALGDVTTVCSTV